MLDHFGDFKDVIFNVVQKLFILDSSRVSQELIKQGKGDVVVKIPWI